MKLNNPGLYVLFVFVIVLVVTFLTSLVYRFLILNIQRERRSHHKIIDLKLGHERAVMVSQMETQEATYNNIFREIHDNINMSLVLASFTLKVIKWNQPDTARQQVSEALAALNKSITDISALSRGMISDVLGHRGLFDAINEEMIRIRRIGLLAIHYEVVGEPVFMPPKNELLIFRIVQESFSNIVKHAEATESSLLLTYTPHTLYITITDNGKGFSKTDPDFKNGAGLINIHSRIKLLQGSISIRSEKGKGVSTEIKIPIYDKH